MAWWYRSSANAVLSLASSTWSATGALGDVFRARFDWTTEKLVGPGAGAGLVLAVHATEATLAPSASIVRGAR